NNVASRQILAQSLLDLIDQKKSTADTAYVPETVNNLEKSYEPEINEITNCSSLEPAHEIEVVASQSVIADIPQEEISVVDSKIEIERPEEEDSSVDSLPGPKGTPPTINDVNSQTFSNIATEFIQDLLEELLGPRGTLSSDNLLLKDVKFSSPKTIVPGSISIKRLANSFCQANGARNKSIIAKQTEISLWWCYSEKFEDKFVELRSGNKKLTDQTARKQIYNEMKLYLTGVSDVYLRKITSKARKINKLFGYEYDPVTLQKIKGIGRHMIQRVTYSVDSISRLTNPQIEYIIEQSYENEIASTIANTSANNPSDDNFSDTSNITDYFKEEGANDSAE
ncbi:7852_t:CDS:2, partial [Funneliformis geosporum]